MYPGGNAYTTDGLVVSLGINSILSIGSLTFRLGPQSVFTVAGDIFTARLTGFELAGTSVLPGGKGVDEGGRMVRLDKGGVLRIGGATVTLVGSTTSTGLGLGSTTMGTGLGGAVMSGFGGGVVFHGAGGGGGRMDRWGVGFAVGVGLLVGVGAVLL